MEKRIIIFLLILSLIILTGCDYRTKLSNNECKEIYNYAKENVNFQEENDYLYYDYSSELLLINQDGQLYCNKDSGFFENYEYNKYLTDIQYIINNFTPLEMSGYKIHSQVEYIVNIEYDFKVIEEETNLKINNYNLSFYKNSNIGVEIEICNDPKNTYSIGIVIGNIEISKYNRYDLNKIIL